MYCLLSVEFEANVEYVEFTIPSDFPFQLRKYIPNIHFSPHDVLDDEGIRFVERHDNTKYSPSGQYVASSFLFVRH